MTSGPDTFTVNVSDAERLPESVTLAVTIVVPGLTKLASIAAPVVEL